MWWKRQPAGAGFALFRRTERSRERRRLRGSPHGAEPVADWLAGVPSDVAAAVWSVRRDLAGRSQPEALAALNAAGVTVPGDALTGLARWISRTDPATLPPEGTPMIHVRMRSATIQEKRT